MSLVRPLPLPPPRPPLAAGRYFLLAGTAAVLIASFRLAEVNPFLFVSPDTLGTIAAFGMGFLPPDLDAEFLLSTVPAVLETVRLATAGTALAIVLGFPLSLLAASNFHLGGPLFEGDGRRSAAGRWIRSAPYWISRALLNFMRSIPELVWALLFVRAAGLGPLAGILGIGVAYAGIMGKVFAEIMEGGDMAPAAALRAAGASRPRAILYGLFPSLFRPFLSYTLYRWECGMRAAAILGFVGAGGLGQHIEISMRMFEHSRTATFILELFLLVALADAASAFLRKKIA